MSYSKNYTRKFMQANSWHHKLFHLDLFFWIWKVWKGRGKTTKIWISREGTKLFKWNISVLKPKFSLSLPLSLPRNAKALQRILFKKFSVFMINFNLYSFSDGIGMFLFEYVILNISMMWCLRKCSTSIKERMYILKCVYF